MVSCSQVPHWQAALYQPLNSNEKCHLSTLSRYKCHSPIIFSHTWMNRRVEFNSAVAFHCPNLVSEIVYEIAETTVLLQDPSPILCTNFLILKSSFAIVRSKLAGSHSSYIPRMSFRYLEAVLVTVSEIWMGITHRLWRRLAGSQLRRTTPRARSTSCPSNTRHCNVSSCSPALRRLGLFALPDSRDIQDVQKQVCSCLSPRRRWSYVHSPWRIILYIIY